MSLARQTDITTPAGPEADSLDDPFRIGIRYVPRTLPDGEVRYDEIPLTLDDLLYPEESDHPMIRPGHSNDCNYLYGCFKALLAEIPRSLVLMDCRVDFGAPGVRPLGPDVSVFHNVAEGFGAATLKVAELGARSVLVVEVTSPETFGNDLDAKVDLYHRANVPCYVIIDSRYEGETRHDVRLIGYRHAPAGYEPIPLDERGRLRVEPLNCWLTIVNDQVVCIDGSTGRPIEPFLGQFQARQVAESHAKVAEARAETAESHAEVAEARAEAAEANARAEAEARMHADARARAVDQTWERLAELARAEAKGRAEANARAALSNAARLDAEARMATMDAELRRLRGEG